MADSNIIDLRLPDEIVKDILDADINNNKKRKEELRNKLLKLFEEAILQNGRHRDSNIENLINKYSPVSILKIKNKIKNILEKDTIKSLKELKRLLNSDSALIDDITRLIATYNRIDKYLHKGTINYADAHIEFTKIDNSALMLVNELDEEDLLNEKKIS